MEVLIGGYCIISFVFAVMIALDAVDDGAAVAAMAFFAVLLFWPLLALGAYACEAYERLSE